MIAKKLGVGIAAVVLAIGGVACGSDDDSAADDVEESSEQSDQPDAGTDPDTQVGTDSGNDDPVVSTDDGGDSKTVPDGWPEFLAVPDGFTIETSQSRTMSDGRDLSLVDALGEGDPGEVFATYKAAVEAAGFQIQFENDLNEVYILTASDGDWTVDVTVEESPRVPGKTLASLSYKSEL